jgi:predicted acyltransferase
VANASLAYALFITLVCGLLLYPLYRQRIFVKI